MVVCLGLVVAQLVNIQLVKAKQLQSSPFNPRIASQHYDNPRGTIYASDGTVLANSIPTPAADKAAYPYHYVRQYPQGPLFSGITGYDSALYYGTAGIEEEYDSFLGPHQQPPQTLSQLLFRQQQPTTTDNVTLTVEPSLQNAAWQALTTLPPGVNKDGAVVVLQPSTGNVLAMVSNPTFDPNALVSTSLHAEQLAYFSYVQKDHEGFYPLRPLANRETFPPGSTMKVVTSTAAYNLKPALAGFNFPVAQCIKFSDSNKQLCDQSGPCGGTMTQMLPFSCDPGYAALGLQLGVPIMTKQSELFGYNSVPAIDLPGTVTSIFPPLAPNSQAFLGQSSIGQYNVADHGAAERHGGGGDRQQGGVDDAPPHVHHSRLPGSAGPELHPPAGLHGGDGAGRPAGDLSDGKRDPARWDGGRCPLPFLSVCSGQDWNGTDRPDDRTDRYLDDRFRPRQQSAGGRRRRRAPPGEQLRRRQRCRAHHESCAAGRGAAVVGLPALQRGARADVELHLGPLSQPSTPAPQRPLHYLRAYAGS